VCSSQFICLLFPYLSLSLSLTIPVDIHSLWAVAQERELVAADGRGNELVVYDDVPFFWGALCVCVSGVTIFFSLFLSLCVYVSLPYPASLGLSLSP
jgi:hypothetical protein